MKKVVEHFFWKGGGAYEYIIGRIYFHISMERINEDICPVILKCISIMHVFTLGFFNRVHGTYI